MNALLKIALNIIFSLAALLLVGWLGLQVQPAPWPRLSQAQSELETLPLPDNLPAPVARFYRQVYGERVPRITTAVISGRAEMRVGGITFPARFRFVHQAGQGYRHEIETTLFGLPLMKVHETYVEGAARLELPFGVIENSPKVDQAANLGLWAESIWLPALYLTDPRVRWEPVDAVTALLVVPFSEEEQRFVVRFDPESGMPRLMETMRYKDPGSESETLWLNEIIEWGVVDGKYVPTIASATWLDEGTPWAVFRVEEVIYNADVQP